MSAKPITDPATGRAFRETGEHRPPCRGEYFLLDRGDPDAVGLAMDDWREPRRRWIVVPTDEEDPRPVRHPEVREDAAALLREVLHYATDPLIRAARDRDAGPDGYGPQLAALVGDLLEGRTFPCDGGCGIRVGALVRRCRSCSAGATEGR